ncbi:class I SAM-dependent methyltransferase [Saccharothrix longispora]|uniref:class I SAM-dependent methyltransferase n=1 Tax=Saccharothrix longispora TaxID=33920 RepID=UPI0028FD17C6|nr:class I SAM-dependent methyltransferase [Saccharothrix longispora]MDU0288120.1 class I SAM-dependent methyltransferase [Saccharothrix longispora]
MTEDPAKTAALYDAINTWGDSDDFHLDLVRSADAVLDVGCGTGALLHAARASGHTGRLVGLDPDPHALAVARRHEGVEWVEGVLGTAGYEAEFDLVVMTGHVFQVFLTDDDVRAQFTAVRRALRPGGRYAFETRNPGARAWERWTPGHGVDITGENGERVRVEHRVEDVRDGLVRFSETHSSPDWAEDVVERATLRFTTAEQVDALLAETGFEVLERHGSWDRAPLTATSREIITVARPALSAEAAVGLPRRIGDEPRGSRTTWTTGNGSGA